MALAADYALRKKFFSNRSSAIFPIYFLSHNNDLIISFLNYWNIKENIPISDLSINYRIYSKAGELVSREVWRDFKDSNIFSVRDFISDKIFSGMIEIEVISTSNLRFPFPALTGFYKSESLYSCVHSAGRIKGADENHTSLVSEETNWTCKFNKQITPFFHYFNSNSFSEEEIKVHLYEGNGDLVNQVSIRREMNPFSSEIFFIDELFPSQKFNSTMFVGVICKIDSAYRRMVVGNYHRKLNHLEVTHSFPKQVEKDFCKSNDYGYESFINIFSDKRFDLSLRVFPTNIDGSFTSVAKDQSYKESCLKKIDKEFCFSEILKKYNLEKHLRLKTIYLKGSKVPSRINTNFNYKVKSVISDFSTDIATGAKAYIYPPHYTNWGSGLIGKGFDFVLLIRNNNHSQDSKVNNGLLKIFGLGKEFSYKLSVPAESSISINLNDLLTKENEISRHKITIFNWILKLDLPHSDTFWISYREEDGCILGEHGF